MRVTRFCSIEEYNKFVAGEVLTNTTDHYRGSKGGSTSIGFCFTKDEPITAFQYLKGIVYCDICMILDIDIKRLVKTSGKYAKQKDGKFICSVLKEEYCCTQYSNKTAKLVRTLKPIEFATWQDILCLKLMGLLKTRDYGIDLDK